MDYKNCLETNQLENPEIWRNTCVWNKQTHDA